MVNLDENYSHDSNHNNFVATVPKVMQNTNRNSLLKIAKKIAAEQAKVDSTMQFWFPAIFILLLQ